MPAGVDRPLNVLSCASGRERGEPRTDGQDRPSVPGDAVLRCAADDVAPEAEGHAVNVKRVRRLMRLIGLMPIYRQPRTSIPAKGHKLYPYLLRGVRIDRP